MNRRTRRSEDDHGETLPSVTAGQQYGLLPGWWPKVLRLAPFPAKV